MAFRILTSVLIPVTAFGIEPLSITSNQTVIADVADLGDRCVASRQPRLTEDEPFKNGRILTDGLGCGYQMDSTGSLAEFDNGSARVWASALTRNNDHRLPQTLFELAAESAVAAHSFPDSDFVGVINTALLSSGNQRNFPVNVRGVVESSVTGAFDTDTELVLRRPRGLVIESPVPKRATPGAAFAV